MAVIYSNGGNRWNILGFNFTKRDALSSVYKISMVISPSFSFLAVASRALFHNNPTVELNILVTIEDMVWKL
jgi:hypothetical protein